MKKTRKLGAPGAAAALLLCNAAAARSETAGLNFQTPSGAAVTDTSLGVPVENWINLPVVPGSNGVRVDTGTTVLLPGAGEVLVEWSAANTWNRPGTVDSPGDPPGAEQVTKGYLDDGGGGYRVRISGLRASLASCRITLISGSDSSLPFADVTLTHSTGPTTMVYGLVDPEIFNPHPAASGGTWSMTPPSDLISMETGNNDVVITSQRSAATRASLAGILLEYTAGAANKPLIEKHPVAPAGTIYTGDTVTFTAAASGSPNVTYQWRKGGIALQGKTDPVLTLSPVAGTDAGTYDVVATNGAGAATSNTVTLNVSSLTTPVFTAPPLSQSLYNGYPATFSATATGGELTYTWKKGETVIPGANTPTLTLAEITPESAGTYTVTAGNVLGSASASATLTVNLPLPGSYEAVQAAQKPLLWFRYSEMNPLELNTGTAANTGSAGAAGNGTAKRYLAFQTPGALAGDTNTAAGLTSNNQFIEIPYNAALNPAVFSAELWVKAPPVNRGRIDPLINRGEAEGDGFLFFGWNGVTKWQFRCYSGTTRTQIASDVDIVPGQWTHLVGVYDGTTARLYVNGAEQGAGTVGPYVPNTAMPIRLAGFRNDQPDVTGGNFAGGALDEVAIYNTALTPARIAEHYQNGITSARSTAYPTMVQADAPAGYWRLDDAAPPVKPTPKNSGTAGVAWTGDYGGDIVPAVEGPLPPDEPGFAANNAAVSMTNGYTAVPPLNITTNNLTVTTWIKRAPKFTTSDLSWPAWLGAGGGFHIDGTGGRPYAELRYHWDGGIWGTGTGLQVPEEVWTFIAMVLEPTRTTMYMGDGNSLRKSVITTTNTPHLLSDPMAFGGNQAGNTGRNFIGQIDESAFYNRALSENELQALFAIGSGAPVELNIASGGLLDDSKPAGTPAPASNFGASWLASGADGNQTARAGVLQFPAGANSQVVIPARPELDSPTGTIAFWMKSPLPTAPGAEAAMLVDHRTGAGAVLALSAASGDLFFQTSPGGANTFTGGVSIADDLWHHVAVTWDQSATGTVSLYVDGTLASSQLNTTAWTWPANQPIEIGRSHDNYWMKYGGMMDDFRIYNQELTAAQIAGVASTGDLAVPAALIGRYEFGSAGRGMTLTWPFGVLETSTLQPGDPWVPVPGALSPLPLPTAPEKARFYRATLP